MSNDDKKLCCAWTVCLATCGFIIFIFCQAFSFNIVHPNEMAIVRDKWDFTIYNKASFAVNGRHYVGLTKNLIMFNSTKNLIEFNQEEGADAGRLACWTIDGVNVYIELSILYKFRQEYLVGFYKLYGDNWEVSLIRMCFGMIKEVTILYTIEQFFTQRTTIAAAIKTYLNYHLGIQCENGVDVTDILLRSISFDTTMEAAINAKLIQSHMLKSYQNQKTINETKYGTEKIVQNFTNGINEKHNQSYGAGNKTYLSSLGSSLKLVIQQFSTAYGGYMTSATLVIIFFEAKKIDKHTSYVLYLRD